MWLLAVDSLRGRRSIAVMPLAGPQHLASRSTTAGPPSSSSGPASPMHVKVSGAMAAWRAAPITGRGRRVLTDEAGGAGIHRSEECRLTVYTWSGLRLLPRLRGHAPRRDPNRPEGAHRSPHHVGPHAPRASPSSTDLARHCRSHRQRGQPLADQLVVVDEQHSRHAAPGRSEPGLPAAPAEDSGSFCGGAHPHEHPGPVPCWPSRSRPRSTAGPGCWSGWAPPVNEPERLACWRRPGSDVPGAA